MHRLWRQAVDQNREASTLDRGEGRPIEPVSSIIERFKAHTATIAVIGLGYVGLPLACTVARKGFTVLGFDIDTMKVDQLNAGSSYISHIDAKEISDLRKTGRLAATSDFSRIIEAD